MIGTIGRTEVRVVWNWPVLRLSYGRWRFPPEDDAERAWFARCRLGPTKVEVVRYR